MLFLRKSKKGFTLIELMVVVAIIGVLSLLGLRVYTTQMDKSKNAIVKANAGTVQTLIQAELADASFSTAEAAITAIGGDSPANMQNPYDPSVAVAVVATAIDAPPADAGQVTVFLDTDGVFTVKGWGKDTDKPIIELTARR